MDRRRRLIAVGNNAVDNKDMSAMFFHVLIAMQKKVTSAKPVVFASVCWVNKKKSADKLLKCFVKDIHSDKKQ